MISLRKKNTQEIIRLSMLEEINELKTKIIQLQEDKIALQEKAKKLQAEKKLLLQEREMKRGRKGNKNKDKTRN